MSTRSLWLALVLLGIVSLLADVAYEGARSVLGPYLEVLGASAVVVGAISVGELVNYFARYLAGIVRYRTWSRVWAAIWVGYTLNAISVTSMYLANDWSSLFVLAIAERLGKGIRAPPRDLVISAISRGIGYGKGFAIHEVLDQVGAILGPAIATVVAYAASLRASFLVIGLSAIASLVVLRISMKYIERSCMLSTVRVGYMRRLDSSARRLVLALALCYGGFVHWVFISYYMVREGMVEANLVGLLYSLAMLMDTILAPFMGMLFDRYGLRTLVMAPILATAIPISLALGRDLIGAILVATLWGATSSFWETVGRASIARIVPIECRAYAYGVAYLMQGLALTIVSLAFSIVYEYCGLLWIAIPIAVEVSALIVMIRLRIVHLDTC